MVISEWSHRLTKRLIFSHLSLIWRGLRRGLLFVMLIALLTGSVIPPGDAEERVRAFTRQIEFNFVNWTLDALWVKWKQMSLGGSAYIAAPARSQLVLDHLNLIMHTQVTELYIREIYADPNVADPAAAAAPLRRQLDDLRRQGELLAPLAEAVLQDQLGQVLAELGLTLGGEPLPPVLYRVTSMPLALIVSPRDVIRQDHNLSLRAGLTMEEIVALEDSVAAALNVSTMVTNVGGVSTYPTMVMETTDINWLAEVIAHEWVHNYLALRPLGLSYFEDPALRTMNETTASLAGKEIGRRLIERYYPAYLPPESATATPTAPAADQPPPFDFRAEMHLTRITVDQMLAEGRIEEAEAYMEARRIFFWQHGYHLRKLNQAYFAFYGAYADQPGGAAGEDPVGAAVRRLRAQSPSLAAFLNRISWMWSYAQLQRAVGGE